MKTKTKFVIAIVGIIVITMVYVISSSTSQVEAQRTVVIDGDLYTISNLYGSGRLTNSKDIRILFEEKDGKLLVGKGYEGSIPNTEQIGGTQLYFYDNDGGTEKMVSEKSNVNYAIFDKNAENIFYFNLDKLEIYQYNIKNQTRERIIKDALPPRLSPDGKSLAYDKLVYELMDDEYNPKRSPGFAVFDIESKKETIISHSTAGGLQWTPDGQHFVFTGRDGFYMIDSDGKNFTKLGDFEDGTNAYGVGGESIWSSDGKYYVRSFNDEIIVIELDILNKKIITAGAIGYGVSPRWVEEGKNISVLTPGVKVGTKALSVIDLNGKVLSGDEGHEEDYYSPSKGAFRRVVPKPVPPPPPPEPVREIPSEPLSSELQKRSKDAQSSGIPQPVSPETVKVNNDIKQVPSDAIKPVTQ